MKEKRYDYAEKIIKRGKSTIVIPKHYNIYYYVGKKEIANYNSKEDTLYLRSDFLERDFKKDYKERIKGSMFETEYAGLLEKYNNISESTNVSW